MSDISSKTYPGVHMSPVLHMLFHMSLHSISHPLLCNTHFFQCFIYVYFCTNRSLRGYSNILRDWKLNFCEVAGAEQEIAGRRWLWQAQGQEWGENSLGFAHFFFLPYMLQPGLSCSTVSCPAWPPATTHWRSSIFTATPLYHDMAFEEILL